MKQAANILLTLFMCLTIGTALAYALDVSAPVAVFGCVAASVGMSLMPAAPSGSLQALVLRQMWETELITSFRAVRNWMSRIPRKDQYVGNNAINLQEIGADPDVLINNTSYPIAVAQRTDDTLVLALNKYDTTNTKVLHDELYAVPYDKEGSVIRQHREVLTERTGEHGLYLLAPSGNTANTPVINTTGADNGNGRKRLKSADLIAMKQRLDNLKVPQAGRILVLCADHVADLLLEDQSFQLRYNNTERGTVMNQYGFEIFEDVYCPVFNDSNAKKAYGASAAGTDRNSSTVFFAPRAFQASGDVTMFSQEATSDPLNRESIVGFRVYHIIAPMKSIGFGSIVSDDTI